MRNSLLLCFVLLISSCGVMKVKSTKYFSVSNGRDKNYYRLNVFAKTKLGEAEFRSGWYPTESVDMLFGNVDNTTVTEYMKTRNEIKMDINEAIKKTYKMYLDSASKPDIDEDNLEKVLEARRRILAYPTFVAPFENTFEIEYNPSINVAIRHSDEKEVFILSSNPDEVIGKISNFSESQKTSQSIKKLSQFLVSKQQSDFNSEKQAICKEDTIIKKQINQLLEVLTRDEDDRDSIRIQTSVLKKLLTP